MPRTLGNADRKITSPIHFSDVLAVRLKFPFLFPGDLTIFIVNLLNCSIGMQMQNTGYGSHPKVFPKVHLNIALNISALEHEPYPVFRIRILS